MSNPYDPPQGDPNSGQPQYGQNPQPPQYGQSAPQFGQPQPPQYGQGQPPQYGQQGATPYAPPAYDAPQYGPYDRPMYSPEQVTRPQSVDRGVLLLKIAAVLSLLGMIPVLFMRDELRRVMEESLRTNSQTSGTVTPEVLDAAVTGSMIGVVVVGVISAGLLFWLAVMNQQGRNWARITVTVLIALGLLLTLPSLGQAMTLTLVISFIGIALRLGALFFLWQKDSSRYFQDMARTRL